MRDKEHIVESGTEKDEMVLLEILEDQESTHEISEENALKSLEQQQSNFVAPKPDTYAGIQLGYNFNKLETLDVSPLSLMGAQGVFQSELNGLNSFSLAEGASLSALNTDAYQSDDTNFFELQRIIYAHKHFHFVEEEEESSSFIPPSPPPGPADGWILLSPGTPGTDYFGSSVSVGEDYLIMGAERDDTGASDSGSAYIYDVRTGNLLFTLNNPDLQAGDYFGHSVSTDGTHAIVGAERDDTGTSNAGSAYIYDVSTGNLLFTLNNPDPNANDYFGRAVSIDGDYAVVGAERDSTGASVTGSAYIYDVSTGNLLFTLNNPDPQVADYFGRAVSISGNYAIINAENDDTGATDSGLAYIYDVSTGNLLFTLNNPTPQANDYFGRAVSIGEDYAIVGVERDDTGASDSGSAYIYDVSTGNLLFTLNNPDSNFADYFGSSVSVDGNYAVVGAERNNASVASDGSVYIYDASTGALLFTLNNPDPQASDLFGSAVSIDGDYVVVGAEGNDGKTHIYHSDFNEDDVVSGSNGDDAFVLLGDNEVLYGHDGADIFFVGDVGMSTIADFSVAEGDVLDISSILTGYNDGVDDIADFARLIDNGANATLEIDYDGTVGGVNFTAHALILGGANFDVTVLDTMGNLDAVV